ncbi:MAG: class I SAM-dependent RNA methyltransferase [Actinobacteria bacterium]|nr:MAG: class I SAM-dependent RNA methyltransferase [Actinomycetota bacterium]
MSNEDVTIERIVAGGDGMARLADGRVIFVGGTITGERVRVEITTNKKDFARGVALEILDVSPHRVSAPCKFVAAGCGGCSWQHLAVTEHMSTKVAIVQEALRRTAKLSETDASSLVNTGGSVSSQASRTTLRMAVLQNGKLGFRRGLSNELVETNPCLIAHDLLNEIIATVKVKNATEVTLRCSASTSERGVWLHDEHGRGQVTGLPKDVGVGIESLVHEVIAGVKLRVMMTSFFQSSHEAAELLVAAVRAAAGERALSGVDGRIIDAYGGVGLFAATLLSADVPVSVVESSESSCRDAAVNLAKHLADTRDTSQPSEIVRSNIEQWSPVSAGLVIADPARTGLGPLAVSQLAETNAPRIVLVSCDAVAGARDLRLLIDSGYELENVTVLDLFPHTPHIETVSVLQRKALTTR